MFILTRLTASVMHLNIPSDFMCVSMYFFVCTESNMLTNLFEKHQKHYLKTFDTAVFGGRTYGFATLKTVQNKDSITPTALNTHYVHSYFNPEEL